MNKKNKNYIKTIYYVKLILKNKKLQIIHHFILIQTCHRFSTTVISTIPTGYKIIQFIKRDHIPEYSHPYFAWRNRPQNVVLYIEKNRSKNNISTPPIIYLTMLKTEVNSLIYQRNPFHCMRPRWFLLRLLWLGTLIGMSMWFYQIQNALDIKSWLCNYHRFYLQALSRWSRRHWSQRERKDQSQKEQLITLMLVWAY